MPTIMKRWPASGRPKPIFTKRSARSDGKLCMCGGQCIRGRLQPCRSWALDCRGFSRRGLTGAKAHSLFPADAARLKPCPDTVRRNLDALYSSDRLRSLAVTSALAAPQASISDLNQRLHEKILAAEQGPRNECYA